MLPVSNRRQSGLTLLQHFNECCRGSKPHLLQVVQVLSYSPGLLLPAQSKIHSVPLAAFTPELKKSNGDCAVMDGAVLGNSHGVTAAVQHTLLRGMLMGWLGLSSRQAARTPHVFPEGCRLPCVWEHRHGSRHLLIPDIYQTWKRFLQQPLFQHCWMMNSLCSFFLSAS